MGRPVSWREQRPLASRPSTLLGVVAAVASAACGDDLEGEQVDCGSPGRVTVMSYNVAQQGDGARGRRIAEHIAARHPDFVALQEDARPAELSSVLPARYERTADPEAGVSILYDSVEWAVEDRGTLELATNDDGWGRRVAVRARMSSLGSGASVVVYSTHWCSPNRNPDDPCDEQRHAEYAEVIVESLGRQGRGCASIVGGDLNVWDGFEDGMAVRRLVAAGLVDLYRTLVPDGPGITLPFDDGAGGGRLDYLFVSEPVVVLGAEIDDDIPTDQASDHYAVFADIDLSANGAR